MKWVPQKRFEPANVINRSTAMPEPIHSPRYSRNKSFVVMRDHCAFVPSMAAGSIISALCSGLLLTVARSASRLLLRADVLPR
jgi:hypothetical protein